MAWHPLSADAGYDLGAPFSLSRTRDLSPGRFVYVPRSEMVE
jgi:hypothetical protein